MKSPSGGSTLITSAPRSASSRVQYGPDTVVVKSSTRTPLRISLFTRRLGAIFLFHQRQVWAIEPPERLIHLLDRRVALPRFKMLHEPAPRRNHPRISLLPNRPNEMLHHVDQRIHHDHHHRILGRTRKYAMELEVNRCLIVKVRLVARRPLRRRNAGVERLDILPRRPLTVRSHGNRFYQHARLGQMLRLN